MKTKLTKIAAAVLVIAASICAVQAQTAQDLSGTGYTAGQLRQATRTVRGTIVAVAEGSGDLTTVQKPQSAMNGGTVAGGAIGAVVGNGVSGQKDKTLGMIAGGLLGSVIGNHLATTPAEPAKIKAVSLVIEIDGSHELLTIPQGDNGTNFVTGQRVFVTIGSGPTRVIPAV